MVRNAARPKRGRVRRCAAIAIGIGAVVATTGFVSLNFASLDQAAAAQTLYVSSTGLDSGSCASAAPCATVSYALTQATSGATIEVSGTISDHISIAFPVTITTWSGGPAGSGGALNGTFTSSHSVVTINNGVAGVTLKNLTIENGYATGGGGIYNAGTLTVADSTVSGNGNSNDSGGGIYNNGTMTVTDSTITGNTAGEGGGIFNHGTLTVVASTISANTCATPGCGDGGVYSGSGYVANLGASIIAKNTGGNCRGYDSASFSSVGDNLTDDATGTACALTAATDRVNKDPLLGPLAKNGGPTETMLPAATSPAADVISNPTTLAGVPVCPSTDQRGVARPTAGQTNCTIGAVEAATAIPTNASVTVMPSTVAHGTRVAYLIVVTPQSGTGTPKGKVGFSIGSKTLCRATLSGGVAACGATTAPIGTDTVSGTYSGGNGYATSTGTTILTVNKT